MKVYVDKDLCIGCGVCPSVGPEIFKMNDDTGKAETILSEVPSNMEDEAKEGEDNCPVGAITTE